MASSFMRFLDRTQRRTTVGRTPLDEISLSQSPIPDHTQHSQQTDTYVPGGIRIRNSSSERQQTHALDRVATGIGRQKAQFVHYFLLNFQKIIAVWGIFTRYLYRLSMNILIIQGYSN